MLVNIEIKNFGPIGNEPFYFSMEPAQGSKRNLNKSYIIETGFKECPYVMSVAGIFGPNASGKSTIFQALHLLYNLVKPDNNKIKDKRFRFDQKLQDSCTYINIEFIEKNTLYHYELEFNHSEIKHELLKKKDKNQKRSLPWKTLLDKQNKKIDKDIVNKLQTISKENLKKLNSLSQSDILSFKIENILNNLHDNQTLVSRIHNSKVDTLNDFIHWFNFPMVDGGGIPQHVGVRDLYHQDNKKPIVDILNAADFGIYDIEFNSVLKGKQEVLPEFLQDNYEEFMNTDSEEGFIFTPFGYFFVLNQNGDVDKKEIIFSFKCPKIDSIEKFKLSELSDGTRTMFSYCSLLINVLEDGKTLFIDELEKSLHPYLTNYIVNLFNDKEKNLNNAQLIFISHDISLLHKKALQPEQVWCTQKNDKTLESQLFCLSQYKIKSDRDGNYAEKYMKGAYGAIPYIASYRFKVNKNASPEK